MTLSQTLLATLSLVFIVGAANAQETAPASDAEPVSTDQVFPVAKDPDGTPFVKATHGSWDIRCVKSGEAETCTMYMLLKDSGENPTAELTIVPLPQGQQAKAGATLVTPLATLLPRGIAYSIDSDKARRYEFSWCDRGGCVSRFGFTEAEIGYMEKGKLGKLTIVAVANPSNPLTLEVPLDGFQAAWKELNTTAE